MQLYREESSNPTYNAQRNLEGRTHYVDPDTLRFHKSRIIHTSVTDGGLLFALVESYQVDHEGKKRAFRPVIFDVTGYVLHRPELDAGFSAGNKALSAMWDELDSINALEVTEKAIKRAQDQFKREIEYLRQDIAKLKKDNKVA